MAGRRPKPTAMKLLAGNPGHRPLNTNEPKPSGTPTCPRHLDADAKKEWHRISAELIAMGMLTIVDRAALAGYCASWSRWIKAEQQIEKYGMVVKSPKSGFPIQNPYVGISNTAMDSMRKFLVEFGMTPAARSRVNATQINSDKQDDWAEFLTPGNAITDTENVN